jgi:DNA adenine methylase
MKVLCPRCGDVGRLDAAEVRGVHHLRVVHEGDGGGRICHLGMDADGLRQELERALGPGSPNAKIVQIPGGDFHIADLLLPRLERLCAKPKCTLVEVFGGSGYVSQTASRAAFGNIIYNDVNDMLTTLYRHVKENPELLAALLALLPYSRAYHRIAAELLETCREFGSLVAAALAFYAYNTSFMGKVGKGFAYSIDPSKNEAREFRSRTWAVLRYAEAWRDVVIENLDFRDAIRRYDSEKTVFYLDPPYADRSEDYYGLRFTADDLRHMAAMLTEIRGRFLLKLDYRTYELVKDVLPDGRYRVEVIERIRHMKKTKRRQRDTWLLTLVSNPTAQ